MAEKIEGWADAEKQLVSKAGSLRPFFTCEPSPSMTEAVRGTLVIHSGDKHERVFTESEVKAMLEDMRNDPLTDELQRSGVIEPIAAKHGIVLDPA